MSGVTIFLSSLPFLNATYINSSSSSKLSDTISLLSFISHSILLFVKTVGIGVTVGPAVGFPVGVAVGLDVTVGIGTVVGIAVGLDITVGTIVGVAVGFTVGVAVGLGVTVGTIVGVAVGFTVGVAVGLGVAVGTVVGIAIDVAVGVGTVVGVAVGVAVGVGVVGVAVGVAVGIIALTALYAFNLPPLITLPVSAESLSELEHKVSLISFAEIFGFTARITATALATIGVAIEVPDIVP